MKKVFFILLLIAGCCNLKSQDSTFLAPDYEKIRTEIQDSSSVNYYPKLLTRMNAYDSTLTIVDYRHLYYGYIFQKEYEPYWRSDQEEKLLKYYRSTKISKNDYDKIIDLANRSISDFPFDLRQLNFMGYIYHLKGDEEMSLKINRRFQGVFAAIMSSGNGKTCETGYHVISVGHEYVFMNMFQFRMTSQSLTGDCDYISFEKDQRNVEGVYFNIQKMLGINRASYSSEKTK